MAGWPVAGGGFSARALAGVRSRMVRNQGLLNASLSEPQLTLKTTAETNPEETPGRKPGLR